jgi:hypothetical protein
MSKVVPAWRGFQHVGEVTLVTKNAESGPTSGNPFEGFTNFSWSFEALASRSEQFELSSITT